MKISDYIRITKDDIPGTPDWWPRFLERLNPMLETFTTALRHLRIDENCDGTYREIEVSHNKEIEIDTGLPRRPRDVQVVWTAAASPYKYYWQPRSDTKIILKILWDSAPATPVSARLRILL